MRSRHYAVHCNVQRVSEFLLAVGYLVVLLNNEPRRARAGRQRAASECGRVRVGHLSAGVCAWVAWWRHAHVRMWTRMCMCMVCSDAFTGTRLCGRVPIWRGGGRGSGKPHQRARGAACACRVGCVCAYLEDVASTLDLLFVAVDAQLLHVAAQRLRLRMRGALLCTTNTGGGRARHARSATTRGAGASARPPARNVARRLRY